MHTLKKPCCVKNPDHCISLQFTGHGVVLGAHFPHSTPEDAALAQPLDEDALLIGTDQHASLQVTKKLVCDMALAFMLDVLSRGELNSLHAV